MDDNITKKPSKSLVIPTETTTDHMVLKYFPENNPLVKVDRIEVILNRIKIDRIVNNHSSNCNS